MSSRVLTDVAAELAPVPWRQYTSSGTPAAAGGVEAAQLRARIAELEAALEARSRQSYETGVHAGEERWRQALESEVRETVQQLASATAELATTRQDIIQRAEADLLRLSIEIARRVLHRELSLDSSAIEALVSAALEKLKGQEVYRVRTHPDLEKVVRACLDRTGRGQSVAVIGDPVQPKGGAVFEVNRGSLDSSVETQLAEIERGIFEQLELNA